jgi:hypothetical protein
MGPELPPVTSFLKQVDLADKKVSLVITFGGFDEKRYAEAYKKKVTEAGAEVKEVLLLKRRDIKKKNFSALADLVDRCFV